MQGSSKIRLSAATGFNNYFFVSVGLISMDSGAVQHYDEAAAYRTTLFVVESVI
jgi:hypothetical protein